MMTIKHLEGKVAVVTGGAGGIGSWIAKTYAEQGAKVVVVDTGADVEGRMAADPRRVNAVVEEITSAGGEAVGITGDIADLQVAEQAIETAIDNFGGLDIVMCAHGILRGSTIFDMAEDDWDSSIQSHLKGCFASTKYASIYWRNNRERGGRVIYLSSDQGITGDAGQPNFSAAEGGKFGLMRSAALGLGRYGVTSNAILAQAATRMSDSGYFTATADQSFPSSEDAGGTPQDPRNLTPLAVWLASEASSSVTGCIFGASGHRATLYSNPVGERSLWSDEPFFDIDELFEQWPSTLGQ